MILQVFKFAVRFNSNLIALFVEKNDAIRYAKTKHDNYSWVKVYDIEKDEIVYEWIY